MMPMKSEGHLLAEFPIAPGRSAFVSFKPLTGWGPPALGKPPALVIGQMCISSENTLTEHIQNDAWPYLETMAHHHLSWGYIYGRQAIGKSPGQVIFKPSSKGWEEIKQEEGHPRQRETGFGVTFPQIVFFFLPSPAIEVSI